MRRGKEIAQGAHASNQWLIDRLRVNKQQYEIIDCGQISNLFYTLFDTRLHEDEIWWIENGYKKVTLQVSSEEELVSLYNKAKELGLNSFIITDEGLTEFNGVHTKTAVAIGPNKSELIYEITRDLKLY